MGDNYWIDPVNLSPQELVETLQRIDQEGYEVIVVTEGGFPMGPFRMAFRIDEEPNMYYISQKDLALEYDPLQFLHWVRQYSGEIINWTHHGRVPWWKIFQMLEAKLEDSYYYETTMFYIPSSISHDCWSLFLQFWREGFGSPPLDVAWS
ncbi:E4.1 [Snake adenovirus 1]|uniref:Protein E4.1 n=1 Tax=Snake adenovirus serotype 1 TaxID=189830 RepID=E41_ADES1|nr:E4.1 [Snake adenovirus 1]A9CB99.1 RecName: Full=Protein E4.1 [Snake adenovirus 1]ABA47249.1 E4.1 [Snake adenovirus 1]